MMIRQVLKYLWNHGNAKLETEEQKCAFVIAKYAFGFSIILILAWMAYESANFINTQTPFGVKEISFFQYSSLCIAAIGLFGRPGWKIRTWSRESKAEKLDEKISNMLSMIGSFLSFWSFHLIPAG